MSDNATFSTYLHDACAYLQWTEDDLARMSGVPTSVIRGIASGAIRSPDRQTRDRIVAALQAGSVEHQRRAAGEVVTRFETTVRDYQTLAQYQHDAALLAAQGWLVTAQSESKEGAGCLFWLIKPRTRFHVTYQRSLGT